MSKYRDDLDAARYRIVALEERLQQRETELTKLRGDVRVEAKRATAGASRRGRFLVVGISATAVLVGASLSFGNCRLSSHSETRVRAASTGGTATTFITTGGFVSMPAGPQTQMTPATDDAEVSRGAPVLRRPSFCAPRHDYSSPDTLPRGTELVAFDRCGACDCCLPAGKFPPTFFGNGKPNPDVADCQRCSTQQALVRAGIAVTGATPSGATLRVGVEQTVRFVFDRPVAVFALVVKSGPVNRSPPSPPRTGTITFLGYDGANRLVDVAVAEYPATCSVNEENAPDFFTSRDRFVAVEACEGATLARAELRLSELNRSVVDLAFYPPPPG